MEGVGRWEEMMEGKVYIVGKMEMMDWLSIIGVSVGCMGVAFRFIMKERKVYRETETICSERDIHAYKAAVSQIAVNSLYTPPVSEAEYLCYCFSSFHWL